MFEIDKTIESFINKLDYHSIKPENFTLKDTKEFWGSIFNGEIIPSRYLQEINNIEKIKCRNEDLKDSVHPITNVPFVEKSIDILVGNDLKEIKVVVPKFDFMFETTLPKNKLLASDREQFQECNSQLANAFNFDKKLVEKFNDTQIEQILDGETPDGYVWHHDAEVGKMQLVPFDIHQQTGHTGGRSIWGGGNNNR